MESSSLPQFIVHPYFKHVFVPLFTLVLTICFKISSKRTESVEKVDFLVGIDLCVTALLVFIIGMIDLIRRSLNLPNSEIQKLLDEGIVSTPKTAEIAYLLQKQTEIIGEKVALSWIVLLLMFLLTSLIAYLTRKFGWHPDDKPKILVAIIVPNIFGFLLLIVSAMWINV